MRLVHKKEKQSRREWDMGLNRTIHNEAANSYGKWIELRISMSQEVNGKVETPATTMYNFRHHLCTKSGFEVIPNLCIWQQTKAS